MPCRNVCLRVAPTGAALPLLGSRLIDVVAPSRHCSSLAGAPSSRRSRGLSPLLFTAAAAALLATMALLPALAAAAAVGAEPRIPPSPYTPGGAVLAYDLGCGGGDKALGPPPRTAASGNGTTYAYWVGCCDFNSSSPPLRLRLNETWSDYDGGEAEPAAVNESTVARVVLIAWSHFGADGGVEVAGPTRAHASMALPLSPNADWADIWGAAPLNVTITNNTFAAGAVIRFVGALPLRSSLLIASNTFADARFLDNSGAFAAGNISLSVNALHIAGAKETLPSNVQDTYVVVAGLFLRGKSSDSTVLALSASDAARVSIARNSASITDSAFLSPASYYDFQFLGAFIHAHAKASQVASIAIDGNSAAVHNSTAGCTMSVYGCNWYSSSSTNASDNASITINGNSAAAHNCTAGDTMFFYGCYRYSSSSSTAIGGNASMTTNGNSAAVHNSTADLEMFAYGCFSSSSITTASDNAFSTASGNSAAAHNSKAGEMIYFYGCFWRSTTTIVDGNALIAVNGNTAVHNSTVGEHMYVYGCYCTSPTTTVNGDAFFTVDGNDAVAHSSTARFTLSVNGCFWDSLSNTTASEYASITANGNSAVVINSTARSKIDVYGCYWSSSYKTAFTIASDNASIAVSKNKVVAFDVSAEGFFYVAGIRLLHVVAIALVGVARLRVDGNTAVLAPRLAAARAPVVEVRGAVLEVAVTFAPSQGRVPGLSVAAGAQVAARDNSVDFTALPPFDHSLVTVAAFALSVSCERVELNCSAALMGLPSTKVGSFPPVSPLLATGNVANVGCGDASSSMRGAPSAVSLIFANVRNVTFGRGAVLSVGGNTLSACATAIAAGSVPAAVRWGVVGDGAVTAVGAVVDARGNTVALEGAISAPSSLRTVGFFLNASHSTASPFYAYCFPVIASALVGSADEAVLATISRSGSPSAAEGAIEGPTRRQLWAVWRVNASYPLQGAPTSSLCAVADYAFGDSLFNNALVSSSLPMLFTKTLSIAPSPPVVVTDLPSPQPSQQEEPPQRLCQRQRRVRRRVQVRRRRELRNPDGGDNGQQ